MKAAIGPLWLLLATLTWPVSAAAAAPLRVVAFSDADEAAAARLLDLIDQPAERVRLPAPVEPQSLLESARAGGFESVVVLDSAAQRVHLLRCRDGTLLTRVVAPSDDASAAYVMAFVAVELLRLSTQLEEPAPKVAAPPPVPEASIRAELRLGAQLTWLGAPFEGDIQPTFGLGLWLQGAPRSPLWWVSGLECAPFARAELTAAGGRVVLGRTDLVLRTGLAYEIGRFSLLAFARARAAPTSAEFLGPGGATAHRWTWGLGAAAEVELRLIGWAKLYASTAIDFAAARSDYRIEGAPVLRDPAELASAAAGLIFYEDF